MVLCYFILRPLEGVPGFDGPPADAAPSGPQPAGSDPPEATSPYAPAGIYAITLGYK